MRVTSSTFPNTLLDQLGRLSTRQNRLQQQASTGQRLTLPEDDPTAMRRVLDMQAESQRVAQYGRNIQRHQELGNASFASIKSLKTLLDRAREIATQADGLRSPEELQVFATEVNELVKQGVQIANAQNRGDYIFGGTRSEVPPFVATLDANGRVTGVAYQGNTDLPESEIAEAITLSAQTLGANTTGSGPRGLVADSRSGADLFGHLIALRDHLASGDLTSIAGSDRAGLAADEDNLIFHVGTNGAIQSQLETTAAVGKTRTQTLEGLVSKEADADLAQTLVRLNEMQTAYQAALQSGGNILSRSLLDFLR
jgi:flagellar hook-associated protein 3 FlgL